MTMKRGRVMSKEEIDPVQFDTSGKEVTPDEAEYNRKYFDYTKVKWPEINPIELVRPDYKQKGTVKLQTYRYPDLTDNKKGIVTFLHGYGDYAGRYAYFAKRFAESGYDFNALDQRGFGNSEGRRGVLESRRIVMDDLLAFTGEVDEKFGGKDVPHFLIGQSLGGFLAASLAAEAPERFAGMSLLVPFF